MLKKKCKVMLLPTDKAEEAIIVSVSGFRKTVAYEKGYLTQSYLNSNDWSSHHLYILSDDEKNVGDWVVTQANHLAQVTQKRAVGDKWVCVNKDNLVLTTHTKKVIASTDRSLGNERCPGRFDPKAHGHDNEQVCKEFCPQCRIPSPTEGFINKYIESYNKGKVIEECMVEYTEEKHIADNLLVEVVFTYPKVRKDNTIIISEIKTEWDRDELFVIMRDMAFKIAKEELLIANEQDVKDYLNSVL